MPSDNRPIPRGSQPGVGSRSGLNVRRLYPGGRAPVVYRPVGLTASTWDQLWPRLTAGSPLRLSGLPPADGTDGAVVLFDSPESTIPLIRSFRVLDSSARGCLVAGDPPSLAWRLAGVQLARGLPSSTPRQSRPTGFPSLHQALPDGRLRLRPDVPCPAESMAPGEDLGEAIRALRAGFFRPEQLYEQTGCPPRRLRPFLNTFAAHDLIVEAPTPLSSWQNPFDFLGLHWSAHDPLIRRRHRALVERAERAPPVAGIDASRFAERALQLLCRPEDRRRIRRELVSPSAILETTRFYRTRLQNLDDHYQPASAADTARRILELDPSDHTVRRTLTGVLCRLDSTG